MKLAAFSHWQSVVNTASLQLALMEEYPAKYLSLQHKRKGVLYCLMMYWKTRAHLRFFDAKFFQLLGRYIDPVALCCIFPDISQDVGQLICCAEAQSCLVNLSQGPLYGSIAGVQFAWLRRC